MTRYRTTQQIFANVLTITNESDRHGIAITKLCHKSNLSHGRLKVFLHNLTSSGLLNTIKQDGKSTFVITPNGQLFLEKYKKFLSIAESFGLEL